MLGFLDHEFRSWKERYPYSPIALVAPVVEGLLEQVGASAAALGIPVAENRAAIAQQSLAQTCHAIIAVSHSTKATAVADKWTQVLRGEDAAPDLDPDDETPTLCVVLDGSPDPDGPADGGGLRAATSNETQIQRQRLDEILSTTDRFNRDAELAAKTYSQAIANNTSFLAPDHIAGLNSRTLHLRAVFGIADTLAWNFQAKTRLAFRTTFGLATAAAACFGLYLLFHDHSAGLSLGGYLLLLLAAYGIYFAAKKADVHGRYIDYRALAEGLRIQFFWTACGIEREVADRYLRKHREFAWIRRAIRLASCKLFEGGESNSAPRGSPREVLAFWIANQKDYFTSALAEAQLKERHARRVVGACFWLGAVATLTNVLLFLAGLEDWGTRHWLQTAIAVIMFLTPPISAGIIGLMQKMGYIYQGKHYSRMLDIYSRADAHSSRCADASVSSIAVALGEEALRENTEWTLFHCDKSVDEPASPFKKPW
jgi:hypothetical protein